MGCFSRSYFFTKKIKFTYQNEVGERRYETIHKSDQTKQSAFVYADPGIGVCYLICYIPMTGVSLAFKNFKYALGIFKSPWCGWDNFRYLFVTGKIWSLTRNTLLYNIAFIFLGLLFEVGFAILLSEINNKLFKKIAQGFMFLPYFISWVVVATVMLNILVVTGY